MGRGSKKKRQYQRRPRREQRPASTATEREQYVWDAWMDDVVEHGRITISLNGDNGMQDRLREIFGVAARDDQLVKIRQKVLAKYREDRAKPPEPLKARPMAELARLRVVQPDEQPAASYAGSPVPIDSERHMPSSYDGQVPPEEPDPPGSTRSTEDAAIRRDWAREYLRRNPKAKNKEIVARCRERFGMGIDGAAIGDLRRELGVGTIKRRATESAARPAIYRQPPEPPRPAPAPAPPPRSAGHTQTRGGYDPAPPDSRIASAVRAAVQLLLDECPELEWLELKIKDGNPTVNYRAPITRVETGEVKL